MTFLMSKEAEEAGERALDTLKQRVFASAFGAFDRNQALDLYGKLFEEEDEPEYDFDIEEFEPESADDVEQMLNEARRAGLIT